VGDDEAETGGEHAPEAEASDDDGAPHGQGGDHGGHGHGDD
jgi:hypothetical protein